jgi:hypothetical protein
MWKWDSTFVWYVDLNIEGEWTVQRFQEIVAIRFCTILKEICVKEEATANVGMFPWCPTQL